MLNYTKTRLKISSNRSGHESKFEQVINMCRKGQERSRGIFRIKHGGDSVMVWGCISASGFGDPVKTDGLMNTVK